MVRRRCKGSERDGSIIQGSLVDEQQEKPEERMLRHKGTIRVLLAQAFLFQMANCAALTVKPRLVMEAWQTNMVVVAVKMSHYATLH